MKNSIAGLSFILLLIPSACTPSGEDTVIPDKVYSTPEAEGISSHAILDFLDALEREQPDAIHSFLVRRHGKIVAEAWWAPYNPDSPHMLYSLNKRRIIQVIT